METSIFLKGLLLGFVIAAPTGPIGILCARRVLTHGRRAAFASGMGAATADVIYGFIAAFGLTFISHLLDRVSVLAPAGRRNPPLFSSASGPFCFSQPQNGTIRKTGQTVCRAVHLHVLPHPDQSHDHSFPWRGICGIRAGRSTREHFSAGILVLGVFLGSALWWLFLIGAYSLVKRFINEKQVNWINKIAGIVIGATGVIALLTILT